MARGESRYRARTEERFEHLENFEHRTRLAFKWIGGIFIGFGIVFLIFYDKLAAFLVTTKFFSMSHSAGLGFYQGMIVAVAILFGAAFWVCGRLEGNNEK